MKKIVLIFAFFWSLLGIASALDYPEKVAGGKLIDLQKFRGIYQKIYQDTNNENVVEICERTLQWPGFWKTINKKDVSLYSILNCQNLNSKEELSNFLNLAKNNIQDFNNFKELFTRRFKLEESLLKLENNLRRTTGNSYIFSDGRNKSQNSAEDTTSDSPFDLVSDLNEIDKILFGEKSQQPKLKFAETTEREISAEIPTGEDNKDNWLTQKTENLPPKQESFDNYNNNLSGSLWYTGKKVLREKLNAYPLWTNYVGKTALDAVATDGTFSNPGFDVNSHETPSASEDSPEATELLYNPLGDLNAYINNYLLAESSYKIDANDGTAHKAEQVAKVLEINDRLKEIIREKITYFERDNDRNSENFSGQRNIINFQMFNQYLDLFREKLRFLRKKVFPDFLRKPQHSS